MYWHCQDIKKIKIICQIFIFRSKNTRTKQAYLSILCRTQVLVTWWMRVERSDWTSKTWSIMLSSSNSWLLRTFHHYWINMPLNASRLRFHFIFHCSDKKIHMPLDSTLRPVSIVTSKLDDYQLHFQVLNNQGYISCNLIKYLARLSCQNVMPYTSLLSLWNDTVVSSTWLLKAGPVWKFAWSQKNSTFGTRVWCFDLNQYNKIR